MASADGGRAPPALAPIVAALPAATPFVGPEALERSTGARVRLRLGANESLFGPSPLALAAMRQAASEIQLYGDPEGYELRAALGRAHGMGAEHVVLGSGIDELLGYVVRAYMPPGAVAVMAHGGYATFAYQVSTHGGRLSTVPYRGDRSDGPALVARARAAGAKILYLANPDNPSGSWLSAEEQLAMLEALPPDCLFLIDEAYADFAPAGAIPAIAADDPRVVRFRTFSKAHGMAGMRVGYAYGAPALIRPIDRIRNQFGVGRMAQAAALAALGDPGHVARVVEAVAEGRRDYARMAAALGLEALPSATNFVAIDLGGGAARARAAVAALLEREGVFIRMPGAPPLDRCIRVTVGPEAERAQLAEALARVLRVV